jgi:hypothetical protein
MNHFGNPCFLNRFVDPDWIRIQWLKWIQAHEQHNEEKNVLFSKFTHSLITTGKWYEMVKNTTINFVF